MLATKTDIPYTVHTIGHYHDEKDYLTYTVAWSNLCRRNDRGRIRYPLPPTDKDAEACYRLYQAYRDGDGVQKDEAKARKWLLGARKLGKPVYNEIATLPWRKQFKLKPGKKLTPKFDEATIREKGQELYKVLKKTHPAIENLFGEERIKTQEKLVRKLLAEGADPNYSEDERNLLYLALDSNHTNIKIAKMLISAGADPESQHRAAWIAAGFAADFEAQHSKKEKIWHKNGDQKRVPFNTIADFLIKNGADFTTHDSAGRAPLHAAVNCRSVKMAELFCKAGADPNMKASKYEIAGPVSSKDYYYVIFRIADEETPLFHAIHNAHTEMVKCLLKHGADPTLSNGKGITPVQMAEQHMQEENRPDYKQKHRDILTLLQQAIRNSGSSPKP